MKIVKIAWMDAQRIDVQTPLPKVDELEKLTPIECHIVGFLVQSNNEAYVIASEYWETEQVKYLHIIPKKSVIKFEILRVYDK